MYSLDTTVKKSRNRSTGYIIAAGAAVIIAIGAIWINDLSNAKKSGLAALSTKLSEERELLRNDVVLHDHFRKLQDLDEKYAMLMVKSPTDGQIDSVSHDIISEENAMKISLENTSAESMKYNTWSNVVMSDSIISAFRKALANRKYMTTLRNMIAGKPLNVENSDKEMMQLQFDMQKKDEKIASLEKELRLKIADVPQQRIIETKAPVANKIELQIHNEQLEASLKEEGTRNKGLLDLNHTLKSDNEKLLAEINSVRHNNAADDASVMANRNKLNSFQEQVDNLNAELNFAKVDCNLTRADAKKIISNSRQRKELLAQALESLQDLAKSTNAAVQRRAKDKLIELNRIASTVRD